MTYRAHIKNGSIVLDEPMNLLEGCEVLIQPIDSAQTLGDLLGEVVGKGKDFPPDGSFQHDHYTSGTPRR